MVVALQLSARIAQIYMHFQGPISSGMVFALFFFIYILQRQRRQLNDFRLQQVLVFALSVGDTIEQ